MSYQVNATDLGNIRLNEPDTVNSILQNIALLLATPKGSAPFYRDFGLNQYFIDKPQPVARALMINEVREAIELWEPRAQFVNISFHADPLEPGKEIPTVEIEITVDE